MNLEEKTVERTKQLSTVSCIDYSIFDYNTRNFLQDKMPAFCAKCSLEQKKSCSPLRVHTYGSFEAERWGGLYIYYCPIGLVYVSSTVQKKNQPMFAMIGGPIVMGATADVITANKGKMVEEIIQLKPRTTEYVNDLAKIQQSLSILTSDRDIKEVERKEVAKHQMLNTLYDVTLDMQTPSEYTYPIEIERQLQSMIRQGDKEGAQELINELLGHMYFQTEGDFEKIKSQAYELIVLFSRASIEGGADVSNIFGITEDIQEEIESFRTLDELSLFLTSVFHRFVGYVFDFDDVKNADIIHKAINYIRENYNQKITLDDVAQHVYLSKSYLSKIFREEMKTSFTSYVNNYRIERSKDLLMDHSFSLADIATLVGFSDQSYFSKVFYKKTNMTPQQYRKSRGNIMNK